MQLIEAESWRKRGKYATSSIKTLDIITMGFDSRPECKARPLPLRR